MARAFLQLEIEDAIAATTRREADARTPPKWRAIHARLNRAAAMMSRKR